MDRVAGLENGIYRYLPVEHELLAVRAPAELNAMLEEACAQSHVKNAAVVFAWTAIPYRMEWRYGRASYKAIAVDAGHVCQNLYLACEATGSAACAIGVYDQEKMDRILGVDGHDEFTVYMAAVGRRRHPGG